MLAVLWIPFTLLAAFMQAWRNAFQKQLSKEVNVAGVTLARFIWASPLAALYLWALYLWQPAALPQLGGSFAGFVVGAALPHGLGITAGGSIANHATTAVVSFARPANTVGIVAKAKVNCIG